MGIPRPQLEPLQEDPGYRMKPKERYLTAEEIARLNAVLTGCRFGEIVSLEWDWIKDKRIFLPDSKSGPRTVWLSSASRAVIDAIPRYSEDCPYLFPARPPAGAAHRQHHLPLGPHPQRGGPARCAAS